MPFSQKTGSIKQLKKQLKKGGNSGIIIHYIPKNDSKIGRFLVEPEDFRSYYEHFDNNLRRSFPCTREDACPGCVAGLDRPQLYLAPFVDNETDQVIPLQIKKSVMNALTIKYEKYGTLLDRDYEIGRYGEGKEGTTYDVTPEAPKKRNLSKYQLFDYEDILQKAYDAVFEDDDSDDEDEAPKRVAKKPGRSKPRGVRRGAPEPFPDDDDDDDDDDFDADEDEDEEDDDDEGPDTDEMKEMPWADLKEYARDIGVKLKTKKRSELIRAIETKRGW
jgi:hypothetical protein